MKKRTGDEPRFRSEFERWVWTAATKYGNVLKFEPFHLGYQIKSTYLPDFELENGIIIEAKGKFDTGMRRKMLAVKESHPHLDIRFVFQRANNTLRKGAKMRYWEWAEKHGFQWAEGSIPPSWFKEELNGRKRFND